MIINGYSTNFYDKYDRWKTEWDSSFIYLVGLTSGVGGSDFSNYLKEIFGETSNFALYLQKLLNFRRTV